MSGSLFKLHGLLTFDGPRLQRRFQCSRGIMALCGCRLTFPIGRSIQRVFEVLRVILKCGFGRTPLTSIGEAQLHFGIGSTDRMGIEGPTPRKWNLRDGPLFRPSLSVSVDILLGCGRNWMTLNSDSLHGPLNRDVLPLTLLRRASRERWKL